MWRRERYGETQENVRHVVLGHFAALNEMQHVTIHSILFGRTSAVSGWLYAGSSDGRVRCWKNINLVNPRADEQEPEVMIQGVSPTSNNLSEERRQRRNHQVTCLAFAGLLVFSASTDGTICVWKRGAVCAPHRLARVFQAHMRLVNCIAAQKAWNVNVNRPYQWVLYSCSTYDKTFKIWSVVDEEERRLQKERRLKEGVRGSGGARGSRGATGSGEPTT